MNLKDSLVPIEEPRKPNKLSHVYAAVLVSAVALTYAWWRSSHIVSLEEASSIAFHTQAWAELDQRLEELSHWKELAPNMLVWRATAALRLGKREQGVGIAETIPNNADGAGILLTEVMHLQFQELNQTSEAVQTAKRVLDFEPRASEPHRLLIFYYALTDQPDLLLGQIQSAIQTGSEPPEAYVYLVLADHLYFSNGAVLNDTWLKSEPENEILIASRDVQHSENESNREKPNFDPAQYRDERLRLIESLHQRFPQNRAIQRYLLRDHARRLDIQSVERLLSQAPAEAAIDSVFWRFRGWYHLRLGELDTAKTAFEKSLTILPTDWNVWHDLGETHRLSGQVDQADRMERVAVLGKEVRSELLRLPNARAANDAQLELISIYLRSCQMHSTAEALERRLLQRGYPGGGNPPERIARYLPYRWNPKTPHTSHVGHVSVTADDAGFRDLIGSRSRGDQK